MKTWALLWAFVETQHHPVKVTDNTVYQRNTDGTMGIQKPKQDCYCRVRFQLSRTIQIQDWSRTRLENDLQKFIRSRTRVLDAGNVGWIDVDQAVETKERGVRRLGTWYPCL